MTKEMRSSSGPWGVKVGEGGERRPESYRKPDGTNANHS